jgi:hypothetical protein
MEKEWQPEIDSKGVNYRKIGQKWVYWTIFPANFRPNFLTYEYSRAAWAGVL